MNLAEKKLETEAYFERTLRYVLLLLAGGAFTLMLGVAHWLIFTAGP